MKLPVGGPEHFSTLDDSLLGAVPTKNGEGTGMLHGLPVNPNWPYPDPEPDPGEDPPA